MDFNFISASKSAALNLNNYSVTVIQKAVNP